MFTSWVVGRVLVTEQVKLCVLKKYKFIEMKTAFLFFIFACCEFCIISSVSGKNAKKNSSRRFKLTTQRRYKLTTLRRTKLTTSRRRKLTTPEKNETPC